MRVTYYAVELSTSWLDTMDLYLLMLSANTYGTTPAGQSKNFRRMALENSLLDASDSDGGIRISFSIMATCSADGSMQEDWDAKTSKNDKEHAMFSPFNF